MLKTLKAKFQVMASYDSLMQQFYQITKGSEPVSQYATSLENKLTQVRQKHPGSFNPTSYFKLLRDRFFHGLPDRMRDSLRYKHDNSNLTYHDLLEEARRIEDESVSRSVSASGELPKDKIKVKGAAAQVEIDPVTKLERAFQASQNELKQLQTKMSQLTTALGNMQASAPSSVQQPVSFFQGSPGNYNPSYRGRGRGAYGRGRGQGQSNYYNNQQQQQGNPRQYSQPSVSASNNNQQLQGGTKPPGYHKSCYWCRDYLPLDQANHLIKDCPYYNQGRSDWWSGQHVPGGKPNHSGKQGNH